MRRLIASRAYRKNRARLAVYYVEKEPKIPAQDSIALAIEPAKGNGRSGFTAMRPDEALSIAGMLIEAVYAITTSYEVDTPNAHAFMRPRLKRR
jgi:hypothetical protein